MADGSIIIDTRIDTGGVSKGMNAVKAGMARISAQVSKMGDSAKSSFQRQITAITGLYQNYEKQERKVSELKSKLEELSKVRIETEEYKKLKDDIKALEDEFEKVETKQREWLDMGFSIDSAPLQELDKQMDDIWADIDRLQRKQKEMQTTGSSSTGKMKTDAETNLAGVKKAAEDASGGVNTTTVTNWGNSASEVKKNLDKMKQTANLKLGEMQKTVESHFSGQYNTMTKKWEKACERIGQLITQMVRSTKDSLNGFTRNMNTIGNEMSNNLINGISGAVTGIAGILNEVVSKVNSTISNVNSSLSGIEKAFTFSYDVTTPDGKRRWGKYSMNLPRVNTVPYLAKGAVIPPRSEFLAVLGDQKQGNNIETPEALLRKIVREETAGRQAGGGSYRFTAQINRRTLFDEMMKEAQMRRDTSGRNPFEMA